MLYVYQHENQTYVRAVDGLGGAVRCLLHPTQFYAIDQYYRQRPIEVCSINFIGHCSTANHEAVLDLMQSVNVSPLYGGWRPLQEGEYNALIMSRLDLENGLESYPQGIWFAINRHPAFMGGLLYAFPNGYRLDLVAFLQEIFDIRRFSDPSGLRNTALSNLRCYFRVITPSTVVKLAAQIPPATIKEQRASLALRAWSSQYLPATAAVAAADPRLFLFRMYYKHYACFIKEHSADIAHGMAMWKVTERFLHFTRQLWLSGLGQDTFNPESFFEHRDEVQGFREYIKPVNIELNNSSE